MIEIHIKDLDVYYEANKSPSEFQAFYEAVRPPLFNSAVEAEVQEPAAHWVSVSVELQDFRLIWEEDRQIPGVVSADSALCVSVQRDDPAFDVHAVQVSAE